MHHLYRQGTLSAIIRSATVTFPAPRHWPGKCPEL